MAPGSLLASSCAHFKSVAKTRSPYLTADATTQSPATSSGWSPPEIPKLMLPDTPELSVPFNAAPRRQLWLQTTDTPIPRAIRASCAREVTAIMMCRGIPPPDGHCNSSPRGNSSVPQYETNAPRLRFPEYRGGYGRTAPARLWWRQRTCDISPCRRRPKSQRARVL